MKTAEEVLKSKGITEKTIFHNYDYLYKSMKEAMKEYAREACLEQRFTCAQNAKIGYEKIGGMPGMLPNITGVMETPIIELP